jgi:hypothetical protein
MEEVGQDDETEDNSGDGGTNTNGKTDTVRRPRTRKQRYSRSRTGCLTCRRRKVKCDEARNVCMRCQDLDIEVSFQGSLPAWYITCIG